MGVDNRGMDLDYMSTPFEQYTDLTAEYRYSLVVEDNNGNLGAVVNWSRLTSRIITTLGLSGLLIGGTLLSLIIRVHQLIWL